MKNNIPLDYSEAIERWTHENVLQLANHFHKLNTTNNQYERVQNFTMNSAQLADFNAIKNSIQSLRIYLALEEENKHEFTFFPVLIAHDAEGKAHPFKLHVSVKKSPRGTSEVVPELFKNMIAKNWDEIDFHLIDDLFTARQQKENSPEVTVRVEYFEISADIIEQVIKEITTITGITFYSGIDMNKFSDKKQISFTPVLGFQYEAQELSDASFGLKGILEFSKGEVFVEYSSPCPPTC